MPFEVIDLETGETYGPFTTHKEAKESAVKSEFKGYSIWNGDGVRVEFYDPSQLIAGKFCLYGLGAYRKDRA